ncbi:MAG: hypothetical protein F4Y08_09205 [Caldilineaceae bacterium SB0662_bin_9]|uniref:Helicase ATP-binding domain-containing protein n=1 Tax=Caldilineaceae bacterium SB0662_bin_9 TaxID=2605258 RepID=A0A6B1DUL4_9CHLR|nr:DEAD/DEAH box helicase family protein [Caldilineaceae bacterium]MYD90495.1 hypothetical protein [Caldilineaceae bacterium SB0662_bin_9]
MFKLLDYQRDAADACIAHIVAGEWPLLVLPTGAGKTTVAIEVARELSAKGRVLYVVDRAQLRDQTVMDFRSNDIEVGIDAEDPDGPNVTVATAQSFAEGSGGFHNHDYAIIDEAQDLRTEMMHCLRAYRFDAWMGMTATPFTPGL